MGKLSGIRKLALVLKRGSPGNLYIIYYYTGGHLVDEPSWIPSFLRDRSFALITRFYPSMRIDRDKINVRYEQRTAANGEEITEVYACTDLPSSSSFLLLLLLRSSIRLRNGSVYR